VKPTPTAQDFDHLESLQAEHIRRSVKTFTLEEMLTSEHAFGLTTATPLQRAICRIADGQSLGDLATHPDVIQAIGDVSNWPNNLRPKELVVLSGIRTAKSLLAAALAVRAALTCDLSRLRPGEVARVSVVSLTMDVARVVVGHLIGTVTNRPALKALLKVPPTADTVTLKHPSGRPVEVRVVAGSKAGGSLVARWSAGCIFDEAPRMNGEADGIINFDDARRAVLGRLLPGAQLVAIGSPWAPRGPIYEAVQEHWKKPSPSIVVIRAPATAMNPVWWTPERCEQLRLSAEQSYRTDVLGEFAEPETALIATTEIDRATRKGSVTLPKEEGHSYVAAMDPGTRGNAWTLVVATKRVIAGRIVHSVALAKQWIGSRTSPLNPDDVLKEIAGLLRGYEITHVWSDQHGADFVKAIGHRHGLSVYDEATTARSKVDNFESMRMRLADDALEIPDDPTFRADLLSIRKRVTQSGISIDLPRTADGRHADYAAALALVLSKQIPDPILRSPALSASERLALIKVAEEQQWADIERKGNAAAVKGKCDWIERMEADVYGEE